MIDNRSVKVFCHEKDEALQGVTDTAICLNFQRSLAGLYPHLILIQAYAYDAWDDIVEPLFHEMVYKTFGYKYGIVVNENESRKYEQALRCSKGVNHIRCIPKQRKLKAKTNRGLIEMDMSSLKENPVVFKAFGDGEHFPSGGFLNANTASDVRFDFVEVEIVCASTGCPVRTDIFISTEDVDFEFVAEK